MSEAERMSTHRAFGMLGMRAQATAAALVQLCEELRLSGVLSDAALERIKEVIADALAEHRPPSMTKAAYLSMVRERLDRVFAGREPVGASPPTFGPD